MGENIVEESINALDILSILGTICSIVGLILSIYLIVQTGKIKKNVDKALEKSNKIINYNKMRADILNGLQESAKFLINEHSPNEREPYLQIMDSCLADFAACYPNMTDEIKQKVDDIRSSSDSKTFSYIKINKPLHDIISILKMEELRYD